MAILKFAAFKEDPLFYGKYLLGVIFFALMYLSDPSPIYAYALGLIAGMGYAEGIYHYYNRLIPLLPKIKFAQYACFGTFTSAGLAFNRLYEDGTLPWYAICAVMVSSIFTLMRHLELEYRTYVNAALGDTKQL